MWSFVINLLFPKYCAGCRQIGTLLCPSCRRELRIAHTQECIYCRKASICGITHATCRKKYGVDVFVSVLHYNTRLKRIVAQIKYHGYLEALTQLLWTLQPPIQHVLSMLENTHVIVRQECVILPIPLHPTRRRARGFNQAAIVANTLRDLFTSPIWDGLQRIKNTPQLAKLPHDTVRKTQIKDAFVYDGAAVPHTVLLVDDVVTTGATMMEATRTLKRAGVQRVIIFSLARG